MSEDRDAAAEPYSTPDTSVSRATFVRMENAWRREVEKVRRDFYGRTQSAKVNAIDDALSMERMNQGLSFVYASDLRVLREKYREGKR